MAIESELSSWLVFNNHVHKVQVLVRTRSTHNPLRLARLSSKKNMPGLITTGWPPPLGQFGFKSLLISAVMLLFLAILSYIYPGAFLNPILIPFLILEQQYFLVLVSAFTILLFLGVNIGVLRATIGRPSKENLNETG